MVVVVVRLRPVLAGLFVFFALPAASSRAQCPIVGDSLPFLGQSAAGYPDELAVAQGVVELAIRGCILERIAETEPFTIVNAAAPAGVPAPGIIETAVVAPAFTILNLVAPEAGSIPRPGLIEAAAFAEPVTIANEVAPAELPDAGALEGFASALLRIQNNAVGGMAALSCRVDADGDGLTNCEELVLGLDPQARDSDGDGVADGDEDTDGDGLANLAELALGTYPFTADSDGDGYSDLYELGRGSDPTSGLARPERATGLAFASAPPVGIDNAGAAGGRER